MRPYLALLASMLFPAFAWAQAGTTFYVCAHPDDCLLFMNPNLYNDTVKNAQKVVVVYYTSGDAGLPFSKTDVSAPYPYARERAAIEASEWMADVGKEHVTAKEQTETVAVHGHPVERVSYANTVSYFLRLPDGDFKGTGFEHYGFQSLRKLKNGETKGISPIDGQAAYSDWQEVKAVLSDILSREAPGEKNVTLHIQEPDIALNPNDHSDHTTGGSGVMEMLTQRLGADETDHCYTIYKHIDYSIAEKPANLEGEALQNKAGSFAVLTDTQRHFLDFHNWDEGHLAYIPRNYYSVETLPKDCDKSI